MTMSCNRCKSNRIIGVNAKCSDMCGIQCNGSETDGYVPKDLGIGGGDYIDFSLCLECGQLQGKFPLPLADIERSITDEELVEFFNNNFSEGSSDFLDKAAYFHQRNIINSAEEISSKLGAFIRNYFEYNVGRQPVRKHPSVDRFVQMYHSRDYDLGYE